LDLMLKEQQNTMKVWAILKIDFLQSSYIVIIDTIYYLIQER
jgi:hypothetical protein